MNVLILGGDGFCGWPIVLRLTKEGCNVLIVDNLVRRKIDIELSTNSLTYIADIETRIECATKVFGKISFSNIDIVYEAEELRAKIKQFRPNAIVHLAELKSAPYSMIDDFHRRKTIDSNTMATHNICSAIVDIDPKIHLVHVGTMGVYGYDSQSGIIPEGYDAIKIDGAAELPPLYPTNPGSIYHLSKVIDQQIFQYYSKHWNIKITDLHQGIVWGVNTPETVASKVLNNRFDYDGIYGTVLNRFLASAAAQRPLTVYGTGEQSRAFININDSVNCAMLSLKSNLFSSKRTRIYNQFSEISQLLVLAKLISKQFGTEINFIPNPRSESVKNSLESTNNGLVSIGFKPTVISEKLLGEVHDLALNNIQNYNEECVLTSPSWK